MPFTVSEIDFTEEIRRSPSGGFLDALESRLYRARKLVVSETLGRRKRMAAKKKAAKKGAAKKGAAKKTAKKTSKKK